MANILERKRSVAAEAERLFQLAATYAGDGAFLTAIEKAEEALTLIRRPLSDSPGEHARPHALRDEEERMSTKPKLAEKVWRER